jgi:endonuclease-3
MPTAAKLAWLVEELAKVHGPAAEPFPADAFEIVLWENVAYLVNDTRRRQAFEALVRSIGTRPEDLLDASEDQLHDVARHGILADHFATKLRAAAEIAWTDFRSDLTATLAQPPETAKRALRKFPGIGEPGAEKILLFTRSHPFLAPESNGLRVLVRFGICPGDDNYTETYAAARDAAREQLGEDFDVLIAARHHLRVHGQSICKRTKPDCGVCPVREECPFPRGADSRHRRGGTGAE